MSQRQDRGEFDSNVGIYGKVPLEEVGLEMHQTRLATTRIHRELAESWIRARRKLNCRRQGSVYLGGFLFLLVFCSIIIAFWQPEPNFHRLESGRKVLETLAGHVRNALYFSSRSSPSGPMNIIFIVADDLGFNDIGFRNPGVSTPNLDKLAQEGVILNQSYVQSTCSPSRAAILTGFYPHKMGLQHRTITHNQGKFIPLGFPTLAEELKVRGYSTSAIGKWHVGHCNWLYTPTGRGFESHFGYFLASGDYYEHEHKGIHDMWNNTEPDFRHQGIYSTDLYADQAVSVVERHAATSSKPLFLYLAFQAIHGKIQPTPQHYDIPHQEGILRPRYTVNDMIKSLDEAVGRVYRSLVRTGMMENTLLIFTSDNGGALDTWGDNSPLRGGKFTQWEGGTRTVTFINGPMVRSPGRTYNGLFHAVDWSPTILSSVDSHRENTDSFVRTKTDGLDLWNSLVENNVDHGRDELIYVLDEVDGTYVFRKGDYKLMIGPPACHEYLRQMQENNGPDPNCWYSSIVRRKERCQAEESDTLLFNVVNDPSERTDLSKSRQDLVTALKRRIEELKKEMVPNQSKEPVDFGSSVKDNVLYPGWC